MLHSRRGASRGLAAPPGIRSRLLVAGMFGAGLVPSMPRVETRNENAPAYARRLESARGDSAGHLGRVQSRGSLDDPRELAVPVAGLHASFASALVQAALLLGFLSAFFVKVIASENIAIAAVLSIGVAFAGGFGAAGFGAGARWRPSARTRVKSECACAGSSGLRGSTCSGCFTWVRPVPNGHRGQPTAVTLTERMSQ